MSFLLLVDSVSRFRENNQWAFANTLWERGVPVAIGLINSVEFCDGEVTVDLFKVSQAIVLGADHSAALSRERVARGTNLWILNKPHPNIERETYAILHTLSPKCRFVNTIEALLFLNNKINIYRLVPKEHLLPSFASSNVERLIHHADKSESDQCIGKPFSGDYGASVFLLRRGDSNVSSILETMAGGSAERQTAYIPEVHGFKRHFYLLQQYTESAKFNEKRVLVVNGRIIGTIHKELASGQHRSNLMHGAVSTLSQLDGQETALCNAIAERLRLNGITVAGIDIAYPFVIEINIVNPGGFLFLEALGQAAMKTAVQSLMEV
jgi:glutathione synthase